MAMFRNVGFALAIGVLLLSVPVSASHCTTWSTTEDRFPFGPWVWTGGYPGSEWYVVWDVCQPGCVFSYWVYEESNDIPGLQRGDVVVDDTCHWMVPSDTIHL